MSVVLHFPERLDSRVTKAVMRFWGKSILLDAFIAVVAKWTPILMLLIITFAAFGYALPLRYHGLALLHAQLAILAAALARLVNEPISRIIARPRPFEDFSFQPLIHHQAGGAFPSNHATGAFALAVAMSSVPSYGSVLFILAVLLCIARVYSGLHHLTDVVAGVLHGTFAASVVLLL